MLPVRFVKIDNGHVALSSLIGTDEYEIHA